MGNFPLLLHCSNPNKPPPNHRSASPWCFILTLHRWQTVSWFISSTSSRVYCNCGEMGQSMSCGTRPEHGIIFASVQYGDVVTVRRVMTADPSLLHQTTPYDRHSVLHVAAASGHIEVSFLRDLAGISPESRRSIAGVAPEYLGNLAFLMFPVFADFDLAFGTI